MSEQKVVITDCLPSPPTVEQKVLDGLAKVVCLQARLEQELVGRVEDAHALIVYHVISLGRATIERLKSCRVIVRCGVGYDNVDLRAADECGIPVINVPDYGTEEVADSALGLTLALTRGITRQNGKLRIAPDPWSHESVVPLLRLRDRVFGVVGLGRIGTATAVRARAFGMDVAFYDPYKADGYDKALGIRRVETFEDLLSSSYVVSLHCPLTRETHHMVNQESINHMQSCAWLVNTARGGVVNSTAVLKAISTGNLAGAGFDVLEFEPPSNDEPILRAWRDPQHPAYDRIIINSHTAFYSEESMAEMRHKAADACRSALLRMPLRNVVNQPVSCDTP